MDGTSETIVLACRKCGKEITRPEEEVGVLVQCSRCDTVNRTPGIAMQAHATAAQLTRIQGSLKRLRIALWLHFCAIIPLSLLVVLSGQEDLAYLQLVPAAFLLLCMMDASGVLGESKAVAFFSVVIPPVWWVVAFLRYSCLKKRVSVLTSSGDRSATEGQESRGQHYAR